MTCYENIRTQLEGDYLMIPLRQFSYPISSPVSLIHLFLGLSSGITTSRTGIDKKNIRKKSLLGPFSSFKCKKSNVKNDYLYQCLPNK